MAHLLALLLLVAPAVETVEERPLLNVSGALAYAGGMAPGDSLGWVLGVRHTGRYFSLGLELQFLNPGSFTIYDDELPGRLVRGLGRGWRSTRGFGVAGTLPVCFHRSFLSACGVVTAGAVQAVTWQPLLSAGIRGAAEYPRDNPIRLRATAQVLGGILRPHSGLWSASPVQLGFSLGVVFDTL